MPWKRFGCYGRNGAEEAGEVGSRRWGRPDPQRVAAWAAWLGKEVPVLRSLQIVATLVLAWLAVFLQAAWDGFRPILGVQPDLLPALMVHTALRTHLVNVFLLAALGGLAMDSLSANPVGVTCLPLLALGLVLHMRKELVLRDQPFAQAVLGALAGAAVPTLTVGLLLSLGHEPLVGWGSLGQGAVLAVWGAAVTPLVFRLFGALEHWFGPAPTGPGSFRPDREIRRGRV